MKSTVLLLTALLHAGLFAMFASGAFAQNYPVRQIRVGVGFPAGTSVDILARVVAQKLNEAWTHPVIVENRSGAGGNIAADFTAKSPADGYTLLLGNNALVISAMAYRTLPYNAMTDLVPVVRVASGPHILVAAPSLPVNSVRELIALAKARPGQLNFASPGVGTPPHLAGELFKSMAHVKIEHIPYKGAGQALTDVSAGQVAIYFSGLPPALPMLQVGKVKALGVTGARRAKVAPQIPTMAEAGLPGYEIDLWYGFFAPSKSPRDVIARLNSETNRILRLPDIQERFATLGLDATGGSVADFEAFFQAEIDKWTKVTKANRLTFE